MLAVHRSVWLPQNQAGEARMTAHLPHASDRSIAQLTTW